MVGVFRRSLSFPNKTPNPPSKKPISHHSRSISLPCRSHPLISQLKDKINDLKSWVSDQPDTRTSAWLCDGLNSLKNVHDYLDDILQLPQTQESLRRQPQWIDSLLEDFLRFVDVYGIFQTLFLGLKDEHLAAQVALRKRDESEVVLYVKARKRMAKEMGKLVSTIRCIRVHPRSSEIIPVGDAELVGVIGDVIEFTVSVSAALFNGISVSFASRKSSWMGLRLTKRAKKDKVEEGIEEFQQVGVESLWDLKKKGDEEVRMSLKKMQDLESCIGGIENGSERVFRGLINARVSLLNTLTQ